jgi:hypothetical protein
MPKFLQIPNKIALFARIFGLVSRCAAYTHKMCTGQKGIILMLIVIVILN